MITAVDPAPTAAPTKGKPGRKPKPRPKCELYSVKFVSFVGVIQKDVARQRMGGTMIVKTNPEGLLEVTDLAEIITRNRQGATKILKRLPGHVFDKSKFVEWNGGNYLNAKDAVDFVWGFPYKKADAEFRRGCCEVIETYYTESGLERSAVKAEHIRVEQHAREGFLIVEDSKSMPGCVKVYKQAIDKVPRLTEKPQDDSEEVVFYMWMPCENYEAELRKLMEVLREKRVTDKKAKGLYYRLEGAEDRLELISYMNARMQQYGKGDAATFYK
jgi:hypothetical protein